MEQTITRQRTRSGNEIVQTNIGLLEDTAWKFEFCPYPLELFCSIRGALAETVQGLAEKFHPKLRYFGYRVGASKERAYIYILKKKLIIDLCISPAFISEIRRDGFEVRPRNNFQGQRGWLTGWEVPQSIRDIKPVLKWLCKALKSAGRLSADKSRKS